MHKILCYNITQHFFLSHTNVLKLKFGDFKNHEFYSIFFCKNNLILKNKMHSRHIVLS
jgi:hypothetical protein